MARYLLISIATLCLLSCQKSRSSKEGNYDKFNDRIILLNDSLGKKYGIREFGLDVECIYQEGDLTHLVSEMLDLGGFSYELVRDGFDQKKDEYYSIISVNSHTYEFRTTSLGDYVDLEVIMPLLDSLVKRLKPSYEYNFSNVDGGQVAFLIFAHSDKLRMAVEEGFPCSLSDKSFKSDINWDCCKYSQVSLTRLPEFDHLSESYHRAISELYKQGYDVPSLSKARIYIDDIFQNGSIDVCIDGLRSHASSSSVENNSVQCSGNGPGLVLAYTLVRFYDGQVSVYNRKKKAEVNLEPKAFIKSVTDAFGKRE